MGRRAVSADAGRLTDELAVANLLAAAAPVQENFVRLFENLKAGFEATQCARSLT
jgi:hypothetical protein